MEGVFFQIDNKIKTNIDSVSSKISINDKNNNSTLEVDKINTSIPQHIYTSKKPIMVVENIYYFN
jgi:hypothetical protein